MSKNFDVEMRLDVKVPMRDGVELSADIYLPKSDGPFPVRYSGVDGATGLV
jgi:predicted acyl esterase